MHSFYTPDFDLNNEQIKQIEKVLRIGPKENIYLFNHTHNCLARYVEKKIIKESLNKNNYMSYQLDCYFPLLKNNNFKIIVQKTTEIGASRIIPLITKRSIVKIDKLKNTRYEKIIHEAAEQSRNFALPKLNEPMDLSEIDFSKYDLVIIPYENENNLKLIQIDELIYKSDKIALVVGPEGGFTTNEVNLLLELKNTKVVTLGKNILRAETAALNCLSIVKAIKEKNE
jgi:16S rRNA (uracil1498-N3)-methyltransferase